MKVTIEKAEKLMERADVSYEVANEALEAANGSLLDAIIALERDGKFGPNAGRGKGGASYSTASDASATLVGESYGAGTVPHKEGSEAVLPSPQQQSIPNFTMNQGAQGQQETQGAQGTQGTQGPHGAHEPHNYQDEKDTEFEDNMRRFGAWLGRVIRAGIVNYFEVWYKGERIFYFPVILFLFCLIYWVFWFAVVILVIGLCCGWRYRFSGPHLGCGNANANVNAEGNQNGTNPHS